MAEDILIQDATSQLAALQSKRISAEELLKLALGRQERLHTRLNAVIKADLTHALERARSIDDTRVKNGPLGPPPRPDHALWLPRRGLRGMQGKGAVRQR